MRWIDTLADRSEPWVALVGRLLMAVLFLMAGMDQIGHFSGFIEKLAADGIPVMLAALVFWFLLLSGLFLALGLLTRPTALAMAGFTLASGIIAYGDLAEPTDMLMLLKNVSLTGGYLVIFAHGAGRLSMDAWIARLSAKLEAARAAREAARDG